MTDEQLMQQVKEHNKLEAYDQLVIKYREPAVKFALRYTADYYLAEDLVQEAFARIYIKRKGYRLPGNFKAYLLQTVRNLATDTYRRRVRAAEQRLTPGLISEEKGPEEEALGGEKKSMIWRSFTALNERYKTALYLQQYEEMSYEEIGLAMGIGTGQVRMLIYRGKKKLKKLLEKELNYDEI